MSNSGSQIEVWSFNYTSDGGGNYTYNIIVSQSSGTGTLNSIGIYSTGSIAVDPTNVTDMIDCDPINNPGVVRLQSSIGGTPYKNISSSNLIFDARINSQICITIGNVSATSFTSGSQPNFFTFYSVQNGSYTGSGSYSNTYNVATIIGVLYVSFSGSYNTGSYAFPETACCFHPQTLISTKNGSVPISNIKSGDIVIKENGDELEVMYNIKYVVKTNKFVKISKGALDGASLPNNDLLMTSGHPLIVDGKEVEAGKLVNGSTIVEVELDENVNVYSICANERTGIMVEGVPALTWEPIEWEATQKRLNIQWTKA